MDIKELEKRNKNESIKAKSDSPSKLPENTREKNDNKSESVELSQKNKSTPQQIRLILFILLTILIAAASALYIFGVDKLRGYATEVHNLTVDATASSKQVQELSELKTQVSKDKGLIERTNSLFATEDNYQAQTLIDVRKYGQLSGINISAIDFQQSGQGEVKKVSVSISGSPSYNSLVKFLSGIENNIPKMEVGKIKVENTNDPSRVSIKELIILIHVSDQQ